MTLLNRFVSRTIVEGKIVTINPLHIGAGEDSLDPVQVDSPVIKDSKRKPLIPGSSLKGVLRSNVEAILSNPAFEGKWRSCNIFSEDECCISKKRADSIKEKFKDDYERIGEEIYKESCDVCRLFGNKYMAAKLKIKDMMLLGKEKLERRDGVGIDRDSGTAYPKAKFNFEVVSAGVQFDFYMVADNLDEKQEKLLNLILQLLKNGEISVGGSTSRGLGGIKLMHEKIIKIDMDNIAKHYGLE